MTQTTHQQPDANDVLMGGGGAASATWSQPGDTVGGRIVAKPQSYHVREYSRSNPGAGPLAYYPSGDPIMGIRCDVQTSERLAADDDGIRRLYIEKKRQLAAVREAVRAANETGIQAGGYLSMTWTGLEQGEGTEPAKTWGAEYRSPTTAVPGGPAPRPAAQPQAVAYTPTPNTTYQPQPAGTATAAPAAQGWVQQAPQPAAATYAQSSPLAAPTPVAAPAPGPTVITETMAAAMRNAGIDTTAFTVIPG